MSSFTRDHSYTLRIAERALDFIKAHRHPADPSIFELWYSYVVRSLPALNEEINETLAQKGALSTDDIDRLYDQYFGSLRTDQRVEKLSEDVEKEIKQIISAIETATNSTDEYGTSLSALSDELDRASDRDSLQSTVERLIQATKIIGDENRRHREALQAKQTEIVQLRDTLNAIHIESQTDPLTKIANRRQFDQSIEDIIAQSERNSTPVTLLMCDIDQFKGFNDAYGHLVGDDVLRLIALTIKRNVKGQDIVARYGGEEFAILLPNTDIDRAIIVAEQISKTIRERDLIQRSTGRNLGRVTLSIGIAQWQRGDDARMFVDRADQCLYAAKNQGRDRIVWTATMLHEVA